MNGEVAPPRPVVIPKVMIRVFAVNPHCQGIHFAFCVNASGSGHEKTALPDIRIRG
jgi:hypothetical protein